MKIHVYLDYLNIHEDQNHYGGSQYEGLWKGRIDSALGLEPNTSKQFVNLRRLIGDSETFDWRI